MDTTEAKRWRAKDILTDAAHTIDERAKTYGHYDRDWETKEVS